MRLAHPAVLVDINRIPALAEAAVTNGSFAIGAMIRQADPRLLRHPLLAEALPHLGHFVTRNRGTVCGSVAHADPAAELALCLVLLGGSVVARSARSEREIDAAEFFVGPYTTTLEPDELVVETRWPSPREGWGYAFCEFAQRHGDYALCMVAAAASADELRVAVGAVVERATLVDVDPERAGESAAAQLEPWGNAHASPTYLRQLVRVLVDQAVARAQGRAAA
jgi:2-furoyl-CoA dehydrogenase FAD binding subunit